MGTYERCVGLVLGLRVLILGITLFTACNSENALEMVDNSDLRSLKGFVKNNNINTLYSIGKKGKDVTLLHYAITDIEKIN